MLDVSVLDTERRPVHGLTAADFKILEDGAPQTIRTFQSIDLQDVVETRTAPWTRHVAPDVRGNDEFKNHRVVLIVLDSSTPMQAADVLAAKRLGWTAINELAPHDLAAVVYTFDKGAGQVFTRDRARLRAAVDRFNGTAESLVPFNEYDWTAETMYRSTLETLRGIADSMAGLPERRKAIIFISVGLPLDVTLASEGKTSGDGDVSHQLQSLYIALQEVIAAAQRANVSIYGADPGRLRTRAAPLNRDFLKTISDTTGGFALVDTNDPAPGIAQVYKENGSYYLLGYEPANSRTEGRLRRIEVRVNRPDVTVRTRSGYFERRTATPAGKPRAADSQPLPLADALVGMVPMADIGLQVTAAAFPRPQDARADVAIAVAATAAPPNALTVTTDDVDVLVHAYDMRARLQASERFTVRLSLGAAGGGQAGYGILSSLTLKPGRYQLRLAVRSSASGKSGSVYYDLEVPDFAKSSTMLSGVMLEVTPPALSAPRGKLAAFLPILPTARREFGAGDQVDAFLRVHEPGKGPLRPVLITTRVADWRGSGVFSSEQTLGPDRFAASRTADFRLTLPMARLAKGPHLLSIVATRGTTTAQRDVPFTVR